jgi:uncharacterized FAD-dependent dehydrogenase
MQRQIEIVLLPEEVANEQMHKKYAAQLLNISENKITGLRIVKRSIDARSRQVKVRLFCDVYWDEPAPVFSEPTNNYPDVTDKDAVVIVGSGPAGLFASLRLIELGIKPIVLERGKDVQARRRDLAAINKDHVVNPDSNYCFGEGGAGTYSDGKLYTRSTKRGDVNKILNTLVAHGATNQILVDAHPHIGTNKLPKLIANIRASIIKAGGEVHFGTKVTDLIIKSQSIKGIKTLDGTTYEGKAVILATGHSARDIFELLHRKNILIEAKPFALGLRIEHQQNVIDAVQYHCETRSEHLPAASYSLVHQVDGRGVYSFCMCPGGFAVPSATAPGEVVVNGMSPSKRDSKFANSGIVVAVELEDIKEYEQYGPLAALRFQQDVEKVAFKAGGKTQAAPAQRMIDFVQSKKSATLPETSYQPGLTSVNLCDVLPAFISSRLKEALQEFGNKMKGYYTNDAVLIGVESRTSSPVKIPRDKESLQHPEIKGLYPCGEGAGYAGGIISAAIDGERCAEKCAELFR